MKPIKTDIYQEIRKLKSTTKLVVGALLVVSLSAIVALVYVYSQSTRYVYGYNSNKELFPLELIEKETIKADLKKSHVNYFVSLFYSIDQFNFKSQIEKALWLIDESGANLYKEYLDSGHYNMLIRTNSMQYVKDINIQVNDNHTFELKALIVINKIGQENSQEYVLYAKGSIAQLSKIDYPKNPFGFQIVNYSEVSRSKV